MTRKEKVKTTIQTEGTEECKLEKVPHVRLISTQTESTKDVFLDYLYEKYPTFMVKYTDSRKQTETGSLQSSNFMCKLSRNSSDWGMCRIRSTLLFNHNEECVSVSYQMSIQPDCQCIHYTPKQRGLSRRDINQVKHLLQTQPNIKPEQAKSEVMGEKMNSLISQSNHKERENQKVQITRMFDYQRQLSRKNGIIATNVTCVRDLVCMKETFTFHLPKIATTNWKYESDIQQLGCD